MVISLVLVLFIGIYTINSILPFIWYEKLNSVAQKYMFIIEKFGYLTIEEKNVLINDLKMQGFKEANIEIDAPTSIKGYGELIEFSITYKLEMNKPSYDEKLGIKKDSIIIKVKKNSFSKR